MERIIAFAAGRSEGNPGPAAFGVYIIETNGTPVQEVNQAIGNARADFAAYYAVMAALDQLQQLYSDITREVHFEVRLDNEVVKKQLNGEIEIMDPGLVPMFIGIHNQRVLNFPHLTFVYINEAENKEANRLAHEAIGGK